MQYKDLNDLSDEVLTNMDDLAERSSEEWTPEEAAYFERYLHDYALTRVTELVNYFDKKYRMSHEDAHNLLTTILVNRFDGAQSFMNSVISAQMLEQVFSTQTGGDE